MLLLLDFLWASYWQVDDEQLVYLQNLILTSNEAVMDAFGVYEEDQDPVRLAESLKQVCSCLLYTSPSPRDKRQSRMPSSA